MRKKKIFGILAGVMVLVFMFTGLTMAASGATNKSPLFSQVQPGGVFIITDQVNDGIGDIWFVDSGHAQATDSASYGRNPDAPFATIDFAIGQTTANNGDRIIVAAGHAENISTASGIDIDVAGIRIIGQGIGRSRPTLTWTAAAGYIEVNAANTSMENMVLDMSTDGIAVTGVSLFTNATDFKFLNNEVILYQLGSGSATRAINAWSGGTRMVIKDSRFIGDALSASGVTEVIAISTGGADDISIIDTYISAYSSSPLINGNGSAVSGFYIRGVDMHQVRSDSQNFDMTSADGIMKDVITSFPIAAGVTLTTSGQPNTNIF